MSRLLQLPPEVLLTVCHSLEINYAIKMRLICKFMKNLLDSDIVFRYHVQLALANAQDGNVAATASEKMQCLTNWKEAWSNHDWSWSGTVTLGSNVTAWELLGGVLGLYRCDPESFHFIQLPSKTRSIPEKRWSFSIQPRTPLLPNTHAIRDFTMDPSQNLLIYNDSLSKDSIHLTVLALREGTPHPNASSHVLGRPMDIKLFESQTLDPDDMMYTLQIHGQYIGILAIYQPLDIRSTESVLFIWDWKSGKLVKSLHEEHPMESFCFLDHHYILTVSIRSLVPVLEVYSVTDNAMPVLTLNLPQTHPASPLRAHSAVLFADCAAQTSTNHLFSTSYQDRLVMASIHFLNEDYDEEIPFVIFAPVSTYLKHVPHEQPAKPVSLEWEAWGPDGTCVDIFSDYSDVWICRIQGMRVILMPITPSTDGTDAFQIRDFSKHFYNYQKSLDDKAAWSCIECTVFTPEDQDPDDEDQHAPVRPFVQDLVSRLPYAATACPFDSRLAHANWMMFEDGIVAVTWPGDDDEEDVNVLHIKSL